jgi:hypothetical protein
MRLLLILGFTKTGCRRCRGSICGSKRAACLASGSEDLSEKDAQDRRQAMMTTLRHPPLMMKTIKFSSR